MIITTALVLKSALSLVTASWLIFHSNKNNKNSSLQIFYNVIPKRD